jgi:catecholate siderophore receptor
MLKCRSALEKLFANARSRTRHTLPIKQTRRPPLAPALVGLASMMFAADAAAQTSAPPQQPSSSPSAQQSITTPGAAPRQNITTLPEINVRARKRTVARRGPPPRPAPAPLPAPAAPTDTHDARTGTVGVYANSTSVATKVNTPLVNIPQSISVLTKDFIKDQNFQSITEVTRYVPGVAVHQGEGNRDELVVRGVDSSANFFVNGFRDDVQIFRDLYNIQSIEVLKGPSVLTFGRGVGGGLVNRTLKEADFTRIYEATAQTGSYWDRRFTLDAGQALNQEFAARLNAMYEGSDTFRQYGHLERYGVNPTFTWKPDNATKVRLSYEYFHDERTADRGNPSYSPSGLPLTGPNAPANAATMRANPAIPFAPNGDLTAFFGSPSLNIARATVQQGMAFVDHDFGNGLTVRNSTLVAQYLKFYQNVYPGNGPLGGAVSPDQSSFNRAAYNHTTNRDNIFNQTDFVYRAFTGPAFHTIAFGTEFDRQTGIDYRNTGIFPNGMNTITADPFNPTYFGPMAFIHHSTGTNADGVTTPDSNSIYRANIASGYARDTIEFTRWLQLIGGVHIDRFDLSAFDANTGTNRNRVDTKVSPSAAAILKPAENVSIYYAYMVSFLPASGDQFSALNNGTVILEPQKFVNNEVGLKWNILPRLQYTAAVYDLRRFNVPIADPNNAGFFLLSGSHRIRGFENQLTGYVTKEWQTVFGYAYTDARITGATSATVVPGNRVQLVPLHQFSWWNKYQFNPVCAASLGVIYFSDWFASSDDTVKLPGFVRVDAGVYAKINETWKAQINVENLFNKGYWASADGNNNVSPGQPRTIRLSATARF